MQCHGNNFEIRQSNIKSGSLSLCYLFRWPFSLNWQHAHKQKQIFTWFLSFFYVSVGCLVNESRSRVSFALLHCDKKTLKIRCKVWSTRNNHILSKNRRACWRILIVVVRHLLSSYKMIQFVCLAWRVLGLGVQCPVWAIIDNKNENLQWSSMTNIHNTTLISFNIPADRSITMKKFCVNYGYLIKPIKS